MAGYGTDEGFNSFLSANGYSLPVGAPSAAVLRHRGSGYIDATYGPRFYGVPTDVSQERAWPRSGASIYGQALASDLVPNRVIEAAYAAAWAEAENPGSLSVVITQNERLTRIKAGSVELQYSDAGDTIAGAIPILSTVEGLLAPLLMPVGGFPAILVV